MVNLPLEEIPFGCFGPGIEDSDFLLGEDIGLDDIANNVRSIDKTIISLNQDTGGLTHRCTAMSTLSIMYSYDKIQPNGLELDEFNKHCIAIGWQEGIGNTQQKGCDIAVKWYNQKYNKKNLYYRGVYTEEYTKKLHELGYGCTRSYKGNSTYNKDKYDNGLIEGTAFGKSSYGHCIAEWGLDLLNDTYPKKAHNQYKLKYPTKLIDNQVFRPTCYWIIPQEKFGIDKEMVKLKKMLEIEKKWNSTVRQELEKHLLRGQIKDEYITQIQQDLHNTNISIHNLLKNNNI